MRRPFYNTANGLASTDLPGFLASIPKSEEVINISAGYNSNEGESSSPSSSNGHSKEEDESAPCTDDAPDPKRLKRESDCEVEGGTSPVPSIESQQSSNANDLPMAVSTTSDLNFNNLLNKNPFIWNALTGVTNAPSFFTGKLPTLPNHMASVVPNGLKSDFHLSDGNCLAALFQIAKDLDCTLICHARRNQEEFCFESNRTAERSGGRGRLLCLVERNEDIVVTDRVNGAIVESETWKKTDFTQLTWAIRANARKCHKNSHKIVFSSQLVSFLIIIPVCISILFCT
ncbi:hypothetical protein L596_023638 [Steinernema carpocapsae]|uniref:Uncharacterized protein n=1 Tax=Steinernema carpocapsae TaxID=34508 RepID=A0A4U5ME89_STECR|nr:hypothetical protein L596_023638 [Steinernema carpocapsae]